MIVRTPTNGSRIGRSGGSSDVYAESCLITDILLRSVSGCRVAVDVLRQAYEARHQDAVNTAVQELLDELSGQTGAPLVRAEVIWAPRPHNEDSELHGVYEPDDVTGGLACITVWTLTARRQDVVRFPTFLRTVLHEFCHHYDYEVLRLGESIHTAGFWAREASLMRSLTKESSNAMRKPEQIGGNCQTAVGIEIELHRTATTYVGSKEALVAAGVADESKFPGGVGNRKTVQQYIDADGRIIVISRTSAKSTRFHVWRGHLQAERPAVERQLAKQLLEHRRANCIPRPTTAQIENLRSQLQRRYPVVDVTEFYLTERDDGGFCQTVTFAGPLSAMIASGLVTEQMRRDSLAAVRCNSRHALSTYHLSIKGHHAELSTYTHAGAPRKEPSISVREADRLLRKFQMRPRVTRASH